MTHLYQNINDINSDYNIHNSKFYSYIYKISTIDEIKLKLKYIKNKFSDSSHICYAYRIYSGFNLLNEINISDFSTDAGEPRGTAGLPTLNVLKKNNLINVCLFTVRYYGGKKLGIPGLIKAYSKSAELVIKKNNLKLWFPQVKVQLIYSYKSDRIINKILKEFNVVVLNQVFKDDILTSFHMNYSLVNQLITKIKSYPDISYKIINK